MNSILINLVTIFELISFMASLVFYLRKISPRYFKSFAPFLLITLIVEITGKLLKHKHKAFVIAMYNHFTVLEIVFYLFIIYCAINNTVVKKAILVTSIIYPVIAAINISHGANEFHSSTYSAGAILLVVFCIFYFYEYFQAPISKNIRHEPPFWICLGLLIFYSCSLPLLSTLSFYHNNVFEKTMFALILSITNYLLYSLFTIAFLNFLIFKKAAEQENILNRPN